MRSGLKAYFNLIFREYDCYGTWLPGTGISLGDIGRITTGGAFQRTGSLSTRGEMPPTHTSDEPNQTIATSGGISFTVDGKVAVDTTVKVGAQLDITFTRAGAAAMVLEDVRRHEFDEEQQVRSLMWQLFDSRAIEQDEVVVTYVKEARSGVIATTYDAKAKTDVDVTAHPGAGSVTLARVGGLLQVASVRSSQTVVTAEPNRSLTPMYRALVFARNRNWWTFWRSHIAIGNAVPTRRSTGLTGGQDVIANARPSRASV